MLSKVKDLNNLKGEFVKFSHARRVGIQNYEVLKFEGDKYDDEDEYEEWKEKIKKQLIKGKCFPKVRTLVIPIPFKFTEILRLDGIVNFVLIYTRIFRR